MDNFFVVLVIIYIGLVIGSFAGAQVWRIRARQLLEDQNSGDLDGDETKELGKLEKIVSKTRDDRSKCLECGHTLAWYDLLPLVSWLSTMGKCRYCGSPIGRFEPMIELGMAGLFTASYLFWIHPLTTTLAWIQFVVWLCVLVLLVILFAYDAKWFLLPDRINIAFAMLSFVFVLLEYLQFGVGTDAVLSLFGSLSIMFGIYAALYYFSRWRYGEQHTWVGFGDVKLGIGLGLLLMTWEKAFLGLFLANLIGTIFVLPAMTSGALGRKSHVPFGPFLIIGTIISVLFGREFIDWYLGLAGGFY
jgi:prepilin signal peptidase PulO-like enzyme (type II secretory pathway)